MCVCMLQSSPRDLRTKQVESLEHEVPVHLKQLLFGIAVGSHGLHKSNACNAFSHPNHFTLQQFSAVY